MNYAKQAMNAGAQGAHVAFALYSAMGAHQYRQGGYNDREARNSFVSRLMEYTERLKKPEDKQAVLDFCAIMHPVAMQQLGYDVTLEARVQSLDRGNAL